MQLDPGFAAQLPEHADTFSYLMQLDGEVFRELENRRTLRFAVNGKRYFLKAHFGVGWAEILKNLLHLRLPVLGARNEWLAIEKLQQLGIDTMRMVACGERGINPSRRQSFIITESLEPTISLEDFCADWASSPPSDGEALRLKRALIKRIASVARRMHASGMNHRDFYICHFLMDTSDSGRHQTADTLKLSLIDLHRAQLRRRTPLRWVVKDIGALYFSSMRIGLTRRDLYRFMKVYRNCSLRETLDRDGKFWSRCRLRACSLYHDFYHELPINV